MDGYPGSFFSQYTPGQGYSGFPPDNNRWSAGPISPPAHATYPAYQTSPTPRPRNPYLDHFYPLNTVNPVYGGFQSHQCGLHSFSQYSMPGASPAPSDQFHLPPQASGHNVNDFRLPHERLSSNFSPEAPISHRGPYQPIFSRIETEHHQTHQPLSQQRGFGAESFRQPVPGPLLQASDPVISGQAPNSNNNRTFYNGRNNQNFLSAPIPAEPTSDDYYLQALADGEFSSPAPAPALFNATGPRVIPPTPLRNNSLSVARSQTSSTGALNNNNTAKNTNMPQSKGPTRPTRRSTRTPNPINLDSSSPPEPEQRSSRPTISTKRPAPTAASRARANATATESRGVKRQLDEEDPFASEEDEVKGFDVVDLVGEAKVEEEPPKKNMVRLAEYNCVICMDDCTNLTVTQCGHLFCAECLHSALNVDRAKTICPICRQKLDLKSKSKSKKPFVHLELKLMSKSKMGKRPAAQ